MKNKNDGTILRSTLPIEKEMEGEYRVTKEIEFCYGHRLRDYSGPCKNIHGHNGTVEIELASNRLDRRGMVADFLELDRIVKNWIEKTIDHKLLLRKDDPLIPLLTEQNEPYLAMEQNPTAEHIAKLIYEFVSSQGLPVISVTLRETQNSAATFRGP